MESKFMIVTATMAFRRLNYRCFNLKKKLEAEEVYILIAQRFHWCYYPYIVLLPNIYKL